MTTFSVTRLLAQAREMSIPAATLGDGPGPASLDEPTAPFDGERRALVRHWAAPGGCSACDVAVVECLVYFVDRRADDVAVGVVG